jgi:K+-sensing histidine kinase KdpD
MRYLKKNNSAIDRINILAYLIRFPRGDSTWHNSSSGLGLTLTKTIIELQGGEISAWNNPGKGATFIMRFPK